MSDITQPVSALTRAGLSASGNSAEVVAGTKGISFLARHGASDDSQRQLVLETLEQVLNAGAMGFFLDPSAEAYRLSLNTPEGPSELGVMPKAAGRGMIDIIQREAVLHVTGENPTSGKFYDGILGIEHRGVERRLRVQLVPTVHGIAATLRVIPSLPADPGDLLALGFSEEQAQVVEGSLKSPGVVLLSSPHAAAPALTCSVCLSKAYFLGRRAVLIAPEPGPDVAQMARIETGSDDKDMAHAVFSAAEAGMNCIGLEQPAGPLTTQAAAAVALKHQTTVLVPIISRNAIDAIGRFCTNELPAALRAAVIASTFQIQLPLLCPNCARWGEISSDDRKFFDIQDPKFGSNVRHGCERCNGEVLDFANLYEVLAVPESVTDSFRKEATFQSVNSELRTAPGYLPMLKQIVQAVTNGRFALNEARQYYQWQIPPA